MKIAKQVLSMIGRCIYCAVSEEPLTEEHIVPYGLSGPWVLKKASCRKCAKITSAFERSLLRRSWLTARAALQLQTRRKDNRPKVYPLQVKVEGKIESIQVPIEEYPAVVILPTFTLPAYLEGRLYTSGIVINGAIVRQVAGPPVEVVAAKYGIKTLQFNAEYQGHSFARLIAKIAYGYAVACLGLENIEEAYVLPAIMGGSQDIGRWVGCDGEQRLPPRDLHAIQIDVVNYQIHGRVRLFAPFQTPEYIVVVGRATTTVYR